MKRFAILALAGLAAFMPASALAQPAAPSHQHGQPAVGAPSPQAGEHKGMHSADGGCDCCAMMKQMMEMMHKMHQHSGQPGMMMKSMPSPGAQPHGSPSKPQAEHEHPDKPGT